MADYRNPSARDRERDERLDRLDRMRQLVATGKLRIWQASPEERERYGIGVPRAIEDLPRYEPEPDDLDALGLDARRCACGAPIERAGRGRPRRYCRTCRPVKKQPV